MMRSTHYLRHSGTPPIRGVDPNHYLQHNRVPRGDPHTICVTLGSLKSEGAIPTTIYSTFASSEALQTSIAKARRAPRVLHFFVFPAPQWNGGLRAPKKAISRRYGSPTDFLRTDARTHRPMQHRRAPQHPQKSTVPLRLSFIWLSFWGPRLSGNSLRALSGTPNLITLLSFYPSTHPRFYPSTLLPCCASTLLSF